MKKKNKNIAGLLALFFGWFGAHRFYLGQSDRGWTFAVLTGLAMWGGRVPVIGRLLAVAWLPVVTVIALVDAVRFFAMDEKRFDKKYNGMADGDFQARDTDFERGKKDTDFEREKPRPKTQRPVPPRRRQHHERRRARHMKKPAARQSHYNKSGKEKFADYDYDGAIEDFEKSVKINPADVAAHFNLACAYSLKENTAKSFYHLELAVAHGFRDFKKIQDHHALAYLRIQPKFEAFVENEYRMPREKETIKKTAKEQGEDLLATQPDLLDQLGKLAEMRKQGFLTEKEFETRKEMLLRHPH